jgi:chemosensory pili system protein ChpA (sensor histidine kinase/response regulator)
MSGTHLSHQSLQWTRPLLDELCEEVRQAVERFGDEDRERQAGDLDSAIEACDKVAGSLAVMEFSSGQLIAEAMGLALQSLRDDKAADETSAIAKVLEATAILPDYLDYLESTQQDAPIVVLPTINDLRGAAGAKLLDEAQFFRPELDVELPAVETPTSESPAELRRLYQHALRGLLINNQDSEAMQKLAELGLKIRDLTELPQAVRRAGWAAAALCEAMEARQIASGPAITRLFARMDVMLKESVEGVDVEALTAKADDLSCGFLFQVAMARAESPLATEVHQAFNLAEHAPDQLTQAKVFLAGRNRALFAAVTQAAREDLARIKDALGSQLERESDPDLLQQQTALLESVGESLAMLGLEHMAARVKAQAGKLADLGNDPDDPTLLMVARELLVVESQLEESFGLAAESARDEEESEGGGTLMPASEQRRVLRQLIKEALEDLAHAKHLLDAVNRQKAEADAVGEARSILARIAGALYMAELGSAATMIESASRIAADQFGPEAAEPRQEALEALAETLTVTEFYLESLTSQDQRGEDYLKQARERLTQLGYWPEEPGAEAVAAPIDATIEALEAGSAEEAPETETEAEFELEEAAEAETSLDFEADQPDEEALDLEDLEAESPADELEPVEQADDELEIDAELASDEERLDEPVAETPAESSTGASAFDDFDIVEIFLEEFDQEYESLNELMPRWQDNPNNEDDTITIRRAFHSLKGSGRMAGATEIGEFAWQIENMLNRVLDRQIQPTPAVTGLVAEAVAALPSMRARLSGDGPGELDEASCSAIAERAGLAADGKLPTAAEAADAELPPELEGLDPTLIDLMIKELSENLETLDDWLNEAEENGHASAIDERMVRAVHTMKGTMRLAPIGDETETGQILEAYLEELSLCSAEPTAAGLEAMQRCARLFHHRLDRLQGQAVDDSVFDTAELASDLRSLHNQAHRDRTSEQAPEGLDIPAVDAGFETETDFEFSSETSEAGDEDFDFFEVDEEAEAPLSTEELGELSEGDETEASEALTEETEETLKREQEAELEAAEEEESATPAFTDEPGALDEDDSEEPATAVEPGESAEEPALSEMAEDEAVEAETAEDEEDWLLETEPEDEAEQAEEIEPELEAETLEAEALEPEALEVEDEAEAEPEAEPELEYHEPEPEPEPAPEAAEEVDSNLIHVDYSEVNEDLLEAFLEEGQELLEHADGLLQKWRETPDDKSLVTALQRDLHTVKGSSRMVGLNPIGQVAHVMEELLEGIATGLKSATAERIDALETGCDHLNAMIDAVIKRQPMPARASDDALTEEVEEIAEAVILPELAPDADQRQAVDQDQAAAGRTETLRVPSALVDDLVNYAGEISIFRSRLEQQISVFRNNVGEVDETVIRLRDQLRKLELETEAQILARYEREHGPADETFDPLELDRYSTIQQLSRALAESVNDLTSLTGILDDATRQSETLLMQQSRVNTELQEGLMQARMVSFNTLLPRFRRVVRNASREVGKKVNLHVELGSESELDRNVLDRITAPLEHLLRNSVSHGVEKPERRRELGKPETGTISIDVGREATELVMRVYDDGAGINLEAVRRRATEQGLLKPGEEIADQALIQMIFRSGFSTAEQVSELAGRGIGMDVVANEVRQIGGSVSAASEAGKGAQFTIRIPLSLTVMQAIMVRAGDRHFAIPLQAVRGVTRILADEWLREIETVDPSQEYAGEAYPLLELEPQLDMAAEEVSGGTLSLLMIEAGDQRAALRVSELMGHREIVIKPIGPQISSIPGILGGTITGDGQVVPILDMGPLIRRAFEREILPGTRAFAEAEARQEAKRTPLVMVVDDSITMRRVTSRVLEHRGLEVMTARDGLDAVEAMFERVPDLILLDIEMPRMDGYELATHVRNDPRLKDVPMMMITSRSGEKHRQRAREIGVNDYLAKPYQEADLVAHVFELLNMAPPEG